MVIFSNGTCVVIAIALVCSSTALILAMAREFHANHPSLEEAKKQRKKIKKVSFADSVKDTKGNGEEYRRRRRELNRRIVPKPEIKPVNTGPMCRISTMPVNALYNGILRNREHRFQNSMFLLTLLLDQTSQ